MGKGARIREQRREEERRRDAEAEIERLIEALQPITTPARFASLVDRRPDLFGEAMLSYLEGLAQDPNIEAFVSRFIRLVERAKSDPADGWRAYRAVLDELERGGRDLELVLEQLKDLITRQAYDDAIRLGETNLPRALDLGLGLVVGEIHTYLADAFRLRGTGDPGDNVDAAIEHTERALSVAVEAIHRVELQMNLAVLVASRKNGDPAENFEHGVGILREALEQLDPRAPGDVRAKLQTNLARTLHVRERGDRLENLRVGRELCESAL